MICISIIFFFAEIGLNLFPTSSDHVVDSDDIFTVDVTVVIFYAHLCISCRCMLNKNKNMRKAYFYFFVFKNIKFLEPGTWYLRVVITHWTHSEVSAKQNNTLSILYKNLAAQSEPLSHPLCVLNLTKSKLYLNPSSNSITTRPR